METLEKPKKKKEAKVVIDAESYKNLCQMMSSSDDGQHIVAFSVLNNVDMKKSFPFVLLLYKKFKETNRPEWTNVLIKANRILTNLSEEAIGSKDADPQWQMMFDVLNKHYPDNVQDMLNVFSETMVNNYIQWGWAFLKQCDWPCSKKIKK